MAIDSALPVRRTILAALKQHAEVTALVAPDRIYPQRAVSEPVFPFIRYEQYGQTRRVMATCIDGQDIDIRLHCFTNPRQIGGIVVETAEDFAYRIIASLATALDRRQFQIDRGHCYVTWIGSYLLADLDEADAFHGIAAMRIRCLTV